MLAEDIQIVSKEFGVKISGKSAASLNLLLTAAMIYAPKALAIWARMQNNGNHLPPIQQAQKPAPSATAAAARKVFDPGAPVAKPDWA